MKYLTILSSLLAVASAAPSSKRNVKRAPLPSNLARDAATLTAFAATVKSDPKGIVKTWVGTNPCKFKGITCAKRPDGVQAVAAVDLNGAKLGPSLKLTGLVDRLTDITVFHANSNEFTGEFPDVSALKYFYELDLSNNKLTGGFPQQTLRATQLTFLDLRFNSLSGPIPPDLFKLDVDTIFVNNNKFTGSISSEIGKSPALYINFANNALSGVIPETIANMPNLSEALFQNNAFTGGIPEKLCSKKGIEILDFSGNKFTTPLGPECLKLQKAKILKV